jgi:hypothetical protein
MKKLFIIPLLCSLAFAQGIGGKGGIGGNGGFGGGVPTISPYSITGKTCAHMQNFANSTCTWSTNPSVGESIHCIVVNSNDGSDTPFSVTDNASTPNTYTANGSNFLDNVDTTSNFQLFDSFLITHSPSTTTFSITGAGNNGTALSCFSTTGGVPAVDGSVVHVAQGTGSTSISVNVNPTGSTDLSECMGGTASAASTFTAGTGYTLIGGILTFGNFNEEVEYQILSSSGSQAAAITYSSSSANAAIICGTYK